MSDPTRGAGAAGSFVCAACHADALVIDLAVDVEPDSDNDEARAQILRCARCGQGALGLYQESRRGALDSDAWRHCAWLVEERVVTAASAALRGTSRPSATQFAALAHGGAPFELTWRARGRS